jgi:hypothetical protein
VKLEFLRPYHGHEEVDEEAKGDSADDDVFHWSGELEFFAEAYVKRAEQEEGERCTHVD